MPEELYEEVKDSTRCIISNYDGTCHKNLRPYEAAVFALK